MVVYTTVTINSVAYSNVENLKISKTTDQFDATSSFSLDIPNDTGEYSDTFNLNEEVEAWADKDINPATTNIFLGIIEDIKYTGVPGKEKINLSGRDYGAILQDIIVSPRIFKNTEVSNIVQSLLIQNVASTGITWNNINATATTLDRITFNNMSVYDAVKQLAELSGYYFYVDVDKDFHFEARGSTSSGETFGIAAMTSTPIAQYRMNDTAATTAVVDATGSYAGTAIRDTVDMHNLLGHWKLNDNAASTVVVGSGTIGNLTASVDTGSLSSPGMINEAFDFLGSPDYQRADKASIAIPVEGAMMCWLKGGKSGEQAVENIYPMGWTGTLSMLGPGDGTIGRAGVITGSGGNSYYNWGNQDIYDDTWQHYALTWDATNFRLYLNGGEIGSEKPHTSEIAGANPATFSIGCGWSNSYGGHTGKLDDIRVYNKKLSEVEISSIYNGGIGTENTVIDGKITNGLNFNGVGGGSTLASHWGWNTSGTTTTDLTGGVTGSMAVYATFGQGKIGSCLLGAGSPQLGSGTTAYNGLGYFSVPMQTIGSGDSVCWWQQVDTFTQGFSGTQAYRNNHAGAIGNTLDDHDSTIGLQPTALTYQDITGNGYSTNMTIGSGPNWKHYFINFGTSDTEVYQNGSYIGSQVTLGSNTIGFNAMAYGYAGNCLDGRIDDFRHYNKQMTVADIRSFYNEDAGTEATSDYVDIGNFTHTSTSNFSYGGWIKLKSFRDNPTSSRTEERMIIGKRHGDADTLSVNKGGKVLFRPDDSTVFSLTSIELDTWTHVFATYEYVDAATVHLKIYINGVLDKAQTRTEDAFGSGNMWLGWDSRFENVFDGEMDDIRVYDVTLDDDEVTAIYNRGTGTEDLNPADGSTNNLFDAKFATSDTDIFNNVTVYGDRQLTGAREEFVAQAGSLYELDDKPYNVRVIGSGAAGNITLQPGGIENIDSPSNTAVQWLVDFYSQSVILTSGTTAGDNTGWIGSKAVIIEYDRSSPLISIDSDSTSIAAYGQKDKIIIDRNIKDIAEANTKVSNFLADHKDPVISGKLNIHGVVDLTPGNSCIVNIPYQDVDNQTYTIISADYQFNKRRNLNDEVLNVTVNKKVKDFINYMKEHELRLRRLEGAEVDTSITSLLTVTGSIIVQTSGCKLVSRSIGSAFFFNSTGHDILNSPSSLLGDMRAGSTVITTS